MAFRRTREAQDLIVVFSREEKSVLTGLNVSEIRPTQLTFLDQAHVILAATDDTEWAHLDIAGMAWRENEDQPTVPLGASGFGIRLLDRYVREHERR